MNAAQFIQKVLHTFAMHGHREHAPFIEVLEKAIKVDRNGYDHATKIELTKFVRFDLQEAARSFTPDCAYFNASAAVDFAFLGTTEIDEIDGR